MIRLHSATVSVASAFNHANAAYNKANTSVDQVARNTANSAFIHANAAFNQANTGGGGSGTDQVARNTANAAFDKANTASLLSNTPITEFAFTGDNSTVEFTMGTVAIQNNVIVLVNGLTQPNSAYTIIGSNTKITMSEAPATGDDLVVKIINSTIDLDQVARDTANAAFNYANTFSTISPFMLMGA